jgi:type 1 glutamine amidotransferase
MKRREMLKLAGATFLGVSAFPLGWAHAAQKKHKILYFSRSVGFQHGPITRKNGELGFSEKLLVEKGKEHGCEVVCSKDGTIFDGDIDQFDCFAFYTAGDLCSAKSLDGAPPMTPAGKKKLLDAVAGGKGFVGIHSASDTFHSKGPRNQNQTELDPYIAMLGGEFIVHGNQQKATMKVASPKFPGLDGVEDFTILEEWYALKNFAKDLHVILVQETKGMAIAKNDACYDRPPFPATWARMHGKGRVFYTSLGHREDVWTNPTCEKVISGGFRWTLQDVEADITPNIAPAAPHCDQLKN